MKLKFTTVDSIHKKKKKKKKQSERAKSRIVQFKCKSKSYMTQAILTRNRDLNEQSPPDMMTQMNNHH